MCPGLVAMITNLICSSHAPEEEIKDQSLKEYARGKSFEIYRIYFPDKLRNRRFNSVAEELYDRFNARALLFALEVRKYQ